MFAGWKRSLKKGRKSKWEEIVCGSKKEGVLERENE